METMEEEERRIQNQFIPGELTADERFEDLLIEGQLIPGDSGVYEDGRQIPWLDMDLAQSGQTFFQKHYASILFAHSLYFGLGFGFKPITGVVLKTRGFHGIEQTTKRLLSTVWHVLTWYESDIIGCYAKGFKAITRIRKTHEAMRRRSSRKSNADTLQDDDAPGRDDPLLAALTFDMKFLDTSTFERLDLSYDPPEHMSQFLMALTQISFLLPVMAHPQAFGIEDTEGVEGFEHLWALIGHLSGLEDRFNLPLQRPGKEFYVRFWREVFMPSFLVRDSKIVAIQDMFYASANSYMPQLSPAAGLYFYLNQAQLDGFNGTELYNLITWKEKLNLLTIRILFTLLTWSTIFRESVNWITRKMMVGVLENFNRDEAGAGGDLTTLPIDMEWSRKYRQPSLPIMQRWKKTQAIMSMMSTAKIRWKNRGRRASAKF